MFTRRVNEHYWLRSVQILDNAQGPEIPKGYTFGYRFNLFKCISKIISEYRVRTKKKLYYNLREMLCPGISRIQLDINIIFILFNCYFENKLFEQFVM